MADTIDTLATALHELRERLGDDAYSDKRRVISLLSDKLPNARREIRAVGTAIDEGVAIALSGSQRQYVGWEMDRQADRLENSTGLNIDLARQTVRALAYSLDLGPLPSIYAAGPVTSPPTSPPPPPPPPRGNSWVDDSMPVRPQPTPPPSMPPSNPVNPNWAPGPSMPPRQPPGYPPATTQPVWSPQPAYGQQQKPGMTRVNKILLWTVIALVAFIAWAIWLGAHDTDNKPAPGPSSAVQASAGPGDESQDFGVAPQSELQSNVGSPTPTTNPVATTITTAQLQEMMKRQDLPPVLVDAWGGAHPNTIKGARHWALLGVPGTFTDESQKTINTNLPTTAEVTGGHPLVFFCAGVKCWESYNATLRANAAGVKNLFWYRGGMAAWEAVNGETEPATATTNQVSSEGADTPTVPGDKVEKQSASDYRP